MKENDSMQKRDRKNWLLKRSGTLRVYQGLTSSMICSRSIVETGQRSIHSSPFRIDRKWSWTLEFSTQQGEDCKKVWAHVRHIISVVTQTNDRDIDNGCCHVKRNHSNSIKKWTRNMTYLSNVGQGISLLCPVLSPWLVHLHLCLSQ